LHLLVLRKNTARSAVQHDHPAANDEHLVRSEGSLENGAEPYSRRRQDGSLPANPRRIIVCADDFGMSKAINEGILALARKGRLSAVSCLTMTPFFREDAHRLNALDVDVGVHLNFTEPGLHPETSRPLPRLIARTYARTLSIARLCTQIERQLDAFEATLGHRPHFVDGHQHVHHLPQIREALIGILRQRYGDDLPWVRSSRPGLLAGLPFSFKAKAHIIGALGAHRFARQAYVAGLHTNRSLLGVYDFRGGITGYVRLLLTWLNNADDGDLLMCHPALASADDDASSAQRNAEFTVLNDDSFPASLQRKGLRLARRP